MPRYFFHLYNRAGDLRDDEGTDLTDVETARDFALRSIRALLSDEVLSGEFDLHGHVDITDSAGAVFERTEFRDAVRIRPA